MKELHEWLEYIETIHTQSMDLSLEAVRKVAQKAHLTRFKPKVVLIAGTNGKGSTLYTLENLLRQANLKVASYTSPHLIKFNERIRIDGQEVDDLSLIQAFEFIERIRENTPLTFFEFTTLAAFAIFQKQSELDVILCEVGLGGRLDAVNILEPQLSIITTIDYDHQAWLGNDLESIGMEKAGILRSKTPCLLGDGAQQNSILNKAENLECLVFKANYSFRWINNQYTEWQMQKSLVNIPQNDLPKNSVSLALAAYNILRNDLGGPDLSEVVGCLRNLALMGRFQKISIGPLVILDVAHNVQSCLRLKRKLLQTPCTGKRVAVWAMLADKPIAKLAELFKDVFAKWHIPNINDKRAQPSAVLKRELELKGIVDVDCHSSPKEAFKVAHDKAQEIDQIVVFGSFYHVGDVLQEIKTNLAVSY